MFIPNFPTVFSFLQRTFQAFDILYFRLLIRLSLIYWFITVNIPIIVMQHQGLTIMYTMLTYIFLFCPNYTIKSDTLMFFPGRADS